MHLLVNLREIYNLGTAVIVINFIGIKNESKANVRIMSEKQRAVKFQSLNTI